MFYIETYMDHLIILLQQHFSHRLLYVGLQGSYLRNEAKEDSDIDVMIVLEDLSIQDLKDYKAILIECGYYEKACGFICGKAELSCWNPLEICQLLHTTKDYYKTLESLVPKYTAEDERNYVKLSLNNLFHELCHRYIHSDTKHNLAKLSFSYKSAFFIIQNMYYLKTGIFVGTKKKLLECISAEEKEILTMSMTLNQTSEYEFEPAFQLLFEWCQKAITQI